METSDSRLISVVIPCFNQANFLFEALASLESARESIYEIIVINDGSTNPNSKRLFADCEARFSNVRVIHQTNQGLSAARNAGVAASSGKFIQFLDADDLLVQGKLQAQLAQLSISTADVSISDYLLCDAAKNEFGTSNERLQRGFFSLTDILFLWERGFVLPIHSALFRREAILDTPFHTKFNAKEDWIFWCELLLKNYRLSYLPIVGAVYRQGEQSMRRNWQKMSESWLAAVDHIDGLVSHRYSTFREKANLWHQQIYLPNLGQKVGNTKEAILNFDSTKSAVSVNRDEKPIVGSLEPQITIVVLVFNHFEYLPACFESIGNQTYRNFEVICVDDCSSDERVSKWLKSLAGCSKGFKLFVNETNQGISKSQNLAVDAAKGEWIAFLDCDDFLEPTALEVMAKAIKENPDANYFFSDREDISKNGEAIRISRYGGYENLKPSSSHSKTLLFGMIASHLKVVRKSSYLDVGGVNETYAGVQDWELALKMSFDREPIYVPEVLYHHRIHQDSVTQSNSIAQFRKTNEVRRNELMRRFPNIVTRDAYIEIAPWPYSSNFEKEIPSGKSALIFKALNFGWSQDEFLDLCKSDMPVFLDMRGAYNQHTINQVREFNSFFDWIFVDDCRAWVALQGYMWADRVRIIE